MSKNYFIYIITNVYNNVLYIGVTNNLERRMLEHINKLVPGFSAKYNLNKLIYFEQFNDVNSAIEREKQLKRWHKDWKLNLIKSKNPNFEDLYSEMMGS